MRRLSSEAQEHPGDKGLHGLTSDSAAWGASGELSESRLDYAPAQWAEFETVDAPVLSLRP